MAITASSAWSAAMRFTVQPKVLENLRNDVTWANPSMAEQGRFDEGSDQILFLDVPDLSIVTPQTPLTEGTAPTARAITMNVRTFGASQYGDVVGTSDIAKVKGPFDVVATITERLSESARQVLNVLHRDSIFTGGTPFYSVVSANTVRSDIATTDIMTPALLPKIYATAKKANLPALPDGSYQLFLSPGQMYDLTADTTASVAITEVSKYNETGMKFWVTGEIGKWRGIRLIETDTIPTFSSTTTVYAGLLRGRVKGWGSGDLQTFRTYHVPAGNDHSDPLAQAELWGWKIFFGVGVLDNTYYYRVETAAPTI